MTTVLVTGAAGYIGSYILPSLREKFDLRLVDNREKDGLGRPVPGLKVQDVSSLDKMEEIRPLFNGVDAVVHLAFISARSQGRRPTIHERFLAERTNVDMAYIVYQLALEEGATRVVVASSNHAADFYERIIQRGEMDVVLPDSPRPFSDTFYGWAKESYEHLGFVYANGVSGTHHIVERPRPLEVAQIRIGAPRDLSITSFAGEAKGDPVALNRDLGAWISPRDLGQLFVKSLEAPSLANEHGVPFQVFYGISGNTRAFWSIANARKVIGYAPQDDSEVVYAEEIRQHLVTPAQSHMVQGESKGGLGHR
jgi:nucleoside-diphosphate-sugar epimerase